MLILKNNDLKLGKTYWSDCGDKIRVEKSGDGFVLLRGTDDKMLPTRQTSASLQHTWLSEDNVVFTKEVDFLAFKQAKDEAFYYCAAKQRSFLRDHGSQLFSFLMSRPTGFDVDKFFNEITKEHYQLCDGRDYFSIDRFLRDNGLWYSLERGQFQKTKDSEAEKAQENYQEKYEACVRTNHRFGWVLWILFGLLLLAGLFR